MKTLARKFALVTLSLSPWAVALYLNYWLESTETWEVEMPFRALASVAMLAIGLLLSFALHSALAKRAD